MKNLICIISLVIVLGSCKKEAPKDYVTLSGTIVKQNSDSLFIMKRSIIKGIKVQPDGTFSDTLKIKAGTYTLFDGKETSSIYLKNGYDLKITLNTEKFDESLSYSGFGAIPNTFLTKKSLLIEKIMNQIDNQNLHADKTDKFVNTFENDYNQLLKNSKDLDTAFISKQNEDLALFKRQLTEIFEEKRVLSSMNGQLAPKFVNYENHAGGLMSLTDLKGKYVYIDLWATWCIPCKKEIPYLKAVEEEYKDKNIEFVSISIDRKSDYNNWKNMVTEEQLSGIQLYALEDQSFAKDFKVSGIPRFILIDPQGKTIKSDAPRPSSHALKNLFNGLNI